MNCGKMNSDTRLQICSSTMDALAHLSLCVKHSRQTGTFPYCSMEHVPLNISTCMQHHYVTLYPCLSISKLAFKTSNAIFRRSCGTVFAYHKHLTFTSSSSTDAYITENRSSGSPSSPTAFTPLRAVQNMHPTLKERPSGKNHSFSL